MTSKLTPALYRGKSLEQQWVNNIYGSHDLFCGCEDPIKHLQEILRPRNQQLLPPWTWRKRWRRKRPRRYWTTRRRFRPTFQRAFYRRRRRRVRKRYYKRYFNKKLKRITLKEWQPKTIRKCAIKGDLCLFACGRYRITHNYTLYSESMVPEGEPGGGAWSIMQLTLRALWDEYVHFRNWWTKSNDGLPLVRYNYCKFKFYRAKECDYIVTPVLTPPFNVGRDDYLNTHPIRALMNRNKIIVTRQKPGQRKTT